MKLSPESVLSQDLPDQYLEVSFSDEDIERLHKTLPDLSLYRANIVANVVVRRVQEVLRQIRLETMDEQTSLATVDASFVDVYIDPVMAIMNRSILDPQVLYALRSLPLGAAGLLPETFACRLPTFLLTSDVRATADMSIRYNSPCLPVDCDALGTNGAASQPWCEDQWWPSSYLFDNYTGMSWYQLPEDGPLPPRKCFVVVTAMPVGSIPEDLIPGWPDSAFTVRDKSPATDAGLKFLVHTMRASKAAYGVLTDTVTSLLVNDRPSSGSTTPNIPSVVPIPSREVPVRLVIAQAVYTEARMWDFVKFPKSCSPDICGAMPQSDAACITTSDEQSEATSGGVTTSDETSEVACITTADKTSEVAGVTTAGTKSFSDFNWFAIERCGPNSVWRVAFDTWMVRVRQEAADRPLRAGANLVIEPNGFSRRCVGMVTDSVFGGELLATTSTAKLDDCMHHALCPSRNRVGSLYPRYELPQDTLDALRERPYRPRNTAVDKILASSGPTFEVTESAKIGEGYSQVVFGKLTGSSEVLCVKLYDERWFPNIPEVTLEPQDDPLFQMFPHAEDLARREECVYKRFQDMQGTLLPHWYGTHLFTLNGKWPCYGVILERIEGQTLYDLMNTGPQPNAETQISLIKQIRHGLRVLRSGQVEQQDWHAGQFICRPRSAADSDIDVVFIDFAFAWTQGVDDYGIPVTRDHDRVWEMLRLCGVDEDLIMDNWAPELEIEY